MKFYYWIEKMNFIFTSIFNIIMELFMKLPCQFSFTVWIGR